LALIILLYVFKIFGSKKLKQKSKEKL